MDFGKLGGLVSALRSHRCTRNLQSGRERAKLVEGLPASRVAHQPVGGPTTVTTTAVLISRLCLL